MKVRSSVRAHQSVLVVLGAMPNRGVQSGIQHHTRQELKCERHKRGWVEPNCIDRLNYVTRRFYNVQIIIKETIVRCQSHLPRNELSTKAFNDVTLSCRHHTHQPQLQFKVVPRPGAKALIWLTHNGGGMELEVSANSRNSNFHVYCDPINHSSLQY